MSSKWIAVLWLGSALLFAAPAHAQTVQPPLPGPWQWTDVGAVGTPGRARQGPNHDLFAAGGGRDIWGTADSFLYVYQPIRDGGIDVHLDSETSTNPLAKAGVMIRQTLDPGSPEVILDVKPDGGVEFMTRRSQGGETTFIAGGSVLVTPTGSTPMSVTLMLSRSGNTVAAAYCDGFVASGQCVQVGTTDFPPGPALIGFAVTSHDPSSLNEAHFPVAFDNAVGSVPFPWSTTDIGDVGTAGDATYEDATGTFFVSGAGSDIFGTADSFHAVTQALTGDASVSARLLSEQDTNVFAKAGVTMGGASPDGVRVILDAKPDGGLEFMARPSTGTPMSFIAAASASFPVFLRLTRTGDQFVGAMSPDGQSWTAVGSVTVTMPARIEAGLAVTSHDPGVLNMARFDTIAATSTTPPVQNLLINAGFEDSTVPGTGPGWVSDPIRQSPAQSETATPHGGTKNGACRTTSLDCGIFQDVKIAGPLNTGNYLLSIYASADHVGALVGIDHNGTTVASRPVNVGGYQNYAMGFFVRDLQPGDVLRVWMYAPAAPGFVVIDDATLGVDTGPR